MTGVVGDPDRLVLPAPLDRDAGLRVVRPAFALLSATVWVSPDGLLADLHLACRDPVLWPTVVWPRCPEEWRPDRLELSASLTSDASMAVGEPHHGGIQHYADVLRGLVSLWFALPLGNDVGHDAGGDVVLTVRWPAADVEAAATLPRAALGRALRSAVAVGSPGAEEPPG